MKEREGEDSGGFSTEILTGKGRRGEGFPKEEFNVLQLA